jgi:putative phosphoesterase
MKIESATKSQLGIISDTHGLLRPEVIEALGGCDAILHAGDVTGPELLEKLGDVAPVHVVRGNGDREWAEHIPAFLDFELAGLHIYMTHRKKDLPADVSEYDLVVFGHSHKYEENLQGKTLLLNAGSCGPRRFHQAITMAIAEIAGGSVEITRIDIPQKTTGILSKTGSADLKKQIEVVIRETRKNRSPEAIADRYGYDKALTEQITRLYLTHPGVTADGIMTKMGF